MNICFYCKKEYIPHAHNQCYCCAECRKEARKKHRYEAQKKINEQLVSDLRKKKSSSKKSGKTLDETVREIEIYNKLHGTRYTYGDWQRLQFFGKV